MRQTLLAPRLPSSHPSLAQSLNLDEVDWLTVVVPDARERDDVEGVVIGLAQEFHGATVPFHGGKQHEIQFRTSGSNRVFGLGHWVESFALVTPADLQRFASRAIVPVPIRTMA
jgi:hypothetical protein